MGTKSANKLREALDKAKNVGLYEESFSLCGLDIVVRNLRPDEYANILADVEELEEVIYLNALQLGHISRALVELNGEDLRNVDYIDDEEPDPKKPGQMKLVKLPRHKWLEANVLSTWGREAIYTAYRKVTDAVEKAERQTKEGIEFIIPEETAEEKFRRIVGEAVEAMEDVPRGIIERVLDENGLMTKSTAAEVKEAMEAADRVAREKIAAEKAQAQKEEEQAAPSPPPPPPPSPTTSSPTELMQRRVPLNQEAVEIVQPTPQTRHAVPATRQPSQPLPEAVPVEALSGGVASRAAAQAALEADADTAGLLQMQGQGPVELTPRRDVPVIEHKLERGDPKVQASIIDQRPTMPLNPRFKPRQR